MPTSWCLPALALWPQIYGFGLFPSTPKLQTHCTPDSTGMESWRNRQDSCSHRYCQSSWKAELRDFLLLARTGLRISDVLGLKFSNINWKENCISLSQQKTGNALSLPLSKELGMAIISYLQDGRPQSSSAFIFLSHNAPFQPLGEHNNFNPEFHKYLRRAGIAIPTRGTQAYTLSAIRLPQICWEKALRCRMCPKSSVTVTSV